MKYELGKKEFKTKTEIRKYFQDFYRSNTVGTVLPTKYRRVMRDLIKWHPLYDEWSLDRRVQFRIGVDGWGSKTFEMKILSGEWVIYSYNKCIRASTKEKYHRKNVIQSARLAITPQIKEFRDRSDDKCELCNCIGKMEIDHHFEKLTFQNMLDNFLSASSKTYGDFKLISTKLGSEFNEVDSASWRVYHKKNAILRSLCWDCHHGLD